MFLVDWPALDEAAALVSKRAAGIDGRRYDILNHAIDRLETKHPTAATILLRAKVDSVLARASATQYGHAVRDLERCAALAPRLEMRQEMDGDDDYIAMIRTKHARKPNFINKFKAAGLG